MMIYTIYIYIYIVLSYLSVAAKVFPHTCYVLSMLFSLGGIALADKNKQRRGFEEEPRRGMSAVEVVGLVLCVVFALLLACNLTIIIKGAITPDTPPSVLGITPLAVQSGSMSGTASDHIEIGDLIFVKPVKAIDLREGDIIAFKEGSIVVTHRIVRIETEDNGTLKFVTKGDANNAEDAQPVSAANLVGKYAGRIAHVGDVALFAQKPVGMALFIAFPVLCFVLYDASARRREAEREAQRARRLERELERLRRDSLT